ncbi:MAG: hypothetical protein KIS62_14015, partial [Ramlibacter sp.]|nr:hypothetical protein [Ramlibacter sp.]
MHDFHHYYAPESKEDGLAVTHTWRSLTALYCSNDYLLLLLQETGRAAVVRHVPWFGDAPRRIMAMAFDPSATWLLCVTNDGGLHVLPVLALLVPHAAPTPNPSLPFRPQDLYSLPPLKALAKIVTSCAWWHLPTDVPMAVLGTRSCTLLLVDLRNGFVAEKLAVPGRGAVLHVQLARDLHGPYSLHALVQTEASHAAFLLQQEITTLEGERLLEFPVGAKRRVDPYAPLRTLWRVGAPVGVQTTTSGKHRVCARQKNLCHVYADLNDNAPLYAYSTPAETHLMAMSDRLLFCIAPATGGRLSLHVVSSLLAAAAAGHE